MRAALENVQLIDGRGDGRDDLDGARPATHDRDPFATIVHLVIPLVGVKGGPGEAVLSREFGNDRRAQGSGSVDVSAVRLTDNRTQVGNDRGFGVMVVIGSDLAVLNKRFPVNRVSQFGRHFTGPGKFSGLG